MASSTMKATRPGPTTVPTPASVPKRFVFLLLSFGQRRASLHLGHVVVVVVGLHVLSVQQRHAPCPLDEAITFLLWLTSN